MCIAVPLLRARPWRKYFKALLLAFAPGLLFYFVVYSITPDNLFFLPAGCIELFRGIDFLNGLLIFILIFHCSWEVLYATAITGFSAGLMVKLERSSPEGMTAEKIIDRYDGCDGMDAIFARRIPNLVDGGYIHWQGDKMKLTRKGRFAVLLALFFKKLLNVGEGG